MVKFKFFPVFTKSCSIEFSPKTKTLRFHSKKVSILGEKIQIMVTERTVIPC